MYSVVCAHVLSSPDVFPSFFPSSAGIPEFTVYVRRGLETDIRVCPTNKRLNPCNSRENSLILLEINQSHSCSHTKPGIAVGFGLSAAGCGHTPTPAVSHETLTVVRV